MDRWQRARANALALRADGLSIREIARRLGLAPSTVGQWLRGRGERFEIRACKLCGERFIAHTGRQRFCTRAHADKHRRVFGPPSTLERYRERASELEGELTRLRTQLPGETGRSAA